MKPRGILIHRCETGSTGPEVKRVEALQGLGYHYFIRRDGTVDLMHDVDSLTAPWHARGFSLYCIGVALHGDFVRADKSRYSEPTSAQWASAVKLCLSLYDRYGTLPIFGHTELPASSTDPLKVCPGEALDVRKLAVQVFALWRPAPVVPGVA